jgi:para-aminobenzoate synthetase/4-amino-4-deoxychorismate lyase
MVLRDPARGRWLRFGAPSAVVVARRVSEVREALREVESAVARRGLWAAGFLAYEAAPAFDSALVVRPAAGFPLAWFGLYGEPLSVRLPSQARGNLELRKSGRDGASLPVPGFLSSGYSPGRADRAPAWRPSVSVRDYARAIRRIRDYIRAGDTYQVNYTFRLRAARLRDPWGFFLRLVAAQGPGYAAYADTGDWALCCASPELFLRLDGERIVSRPMKGTAARGLWQERDLAQAAALRRSEKDRAENIMIVDMVRNDLGRVAQPGSVRVTRRFDVERHPTLWQMTSTVEARTRAPLTEILAATFPPASITGAPKPRTMQIIAELETAPRRVYTGAIGFVAPGRRAQFNVAIRTALVERSTGLAEYGVGGGIVWDSDAGRERMECRTKSLVLETVRPPFELLETLLWVPGKGYALRRRHLARLAQSASYFGFTLRPAAPRLELTRLARRLPRVPHRVRLLVTRDGRCRTEAFPLPAPPARPAAALRVALTRTPVDSGDVFLYHKTTRRAVYERARAERPGFDDVVLFNEHGEVTESTIGNLAVEIAGALCTPPVACGLLAGTFRAQMLSRGLLRERVITVAELLRARRVWLMNSVRGLYPVRISQSGG